MKVQHDLGSLELSRLLGYLSIQVLDLVTSEVVDDAGEVGRPPGRHGDVLQRGYEPWLETCHCKVDHSLLNKTDSHQVHFKDGVGRSIYNGSFSPGTPVFSTVIVSLHLM